MGFQHLRNTFLDGLYTGFDPLGCLAGHILESTPALTQEEFFLANRQRFMGYVADKFTLYEMRVDNIGEIPVRRSLEDQIVKAIGDVVGLSINVCTCGLPQLITLAGSLIKRD